MLDTLQALTLVAHYFARLDWEVILVLLSLSFANLVLLDL
jgi:hypothetical protein